MTTLLPALTTPLGWMPFVSPMPSPGPLWWLFVVPLVFAISMIWKAVRVSALERYWASVFVMTIQILVGVVVFAGVLLLFVRGILPLLPAE